MRLRFIPHHQEDKSEAEARRARRGEIYTLACTAESLSGAGQTLPFGREEVEEVACQR